MRRESWRRGLHTYPPMAEAQPNAAHLAIADWWRAGLVNGVVTQNIDGLHQRAGLPEAAVVELHGNAHWVELSVVWPRASIGRTVHARVAGAATRIQPCPALRRHPQDDDHLVRPGAAAEAPWPRRSAGTRTPGCAWSSAHRWWSTLPRCCPRVTLDAGGRLAIVNLTPTHLDHLAVLVAREPAGVLLAEVQHVLSAARQP